MSPLAHRFWFLLWCITGVLTSVVLTSRDVPFILGLAIWMLIWNRIFIHYSKAHFNEGHR